MTMKIAYYSYDHVANPHCGGGGALRDLTIHRQMAGRHEIHFYCGKFKGCRNYSEKGLQFTFLGWSHSYLISRITYSFFATVHSLFIKADIIVICFSIFSPVMGFLLRKDRCIVELFHLAKYEPFKKYSIFGTFPYLFEKCVLLFSKRIICINKSLAEQINRDYRSKEIFTVYTGFDPSLLLGNTGDDRYLLYLGRIDIHMKGIDLLIDAFERITATFLNYRLIIAGRGSLRDVGWLKNRMKKSPARERIFFQEDVSDAEKKALFHRATFICVPSRFEGWCIAAIEAAASSKATIGTRIVGLSESIIENETGLLIPPGDSTALAEAMMRLLSNGDLRERLGKNGNAWSRNIMWKNIAQSQEACYLSFAKKNHHRNLASHA